MQPQSTEMQTMDVRIYISPTKWQVCSSGVFSQLAHPKPPRTGSLTHVQHKKGSISFPVAFGECYSSREVLNYLPLNSPLPMLHQIAAEILFRRHSWRMKGKEAGVGFPGVSREDSYCYCRSCRREFAFFCLLFADIFCPHTE